MYASPNVSLHDHLNSAQKRLLTAINHRVRAWTRPLSPSDGSGTVDAAFVAPVIGTLESWLLDEEQIQDLTANPADIFFLHAAARLLQLEGDSRAATAAGDPDAAKADTVFTLPDLIQTRWSDLGIGDSRQAEILQQICRGYLAAAGMDADIAPHIDDGRGGRIHIQFLAACLRLAVAFSIDTPAAVAHLRTLLPPSATAPGNDLTPLFSLLAIGPHPHVQATVLVRLQCRDAEVHRALKHYESDLQRLLTALNRIVRPRFLFTAVAFEIQPEGYRPIDFKFCVDTSSALQLFMGNTLYKDRRVFLRELLQNAVDACNLRKMNEPGYVPAIRVSFNSDISRITVRDNGVGMSRQWIEKYFLNIGLSFYQSAEITRINRDQHVQFSFISRFGIGFLSSFLVAEKVTVKTRKAGSKGLVITIARVDDYFDVRIAEEALPVGTEVAVDLKQSKIAYCRSLEYLGYLKTNVRFLPMAVTFVDENGVSSVLGQEPMDYSRETLWGTKFIAKLDYRRSEGYLLLRVQENYHYIHDLEPARGGISVFQDGIFIAQVDHLLPDSAGGYVTGRINLVGNEKCELGMDRNHLYWSKDQLAQTKHKILLGLAAIADSLLAKTAAQPLPENVRVNLTRKLASFFDFNEVDDAIYARLYPELRVRVEDKFSLFIRANRFQFDLARHRNSDADNSHGYTHAWQQRIIGRFLEKAAIGVRRRQMN
jgi:hypothetical protein